MCELVRRPTALRHRRILPMSDKRETDFLAYVLGVFVIAIAGIAVGVASTNTASNGKTRPTGVAVAMPAAPATRAANQTAAGPKRLRSQEQRSQEHLL